MEGSPQSLPNDNDRSNFTAEAPPPPPLDEAQPADNHIENAPAEDLQQEKPKGKAKKLDFHKIYNERRQILVENDAENLVVMYPTLILTMMITSIIASIIGNQNKPIVAYLVEQEDSVGRITTMSDKKAANKNGLILLGSIMGFLVLSTFILCLLFKYKCHLPITIYLVVALLFAGSFVPLLIL
ncbi:MAG: hypothetical protein MHMPM18_003731 [Marteilia pararefringens]